jgi:hypothetical protein
MTLMQQIKTMTGEGFTIEIRDGKQSGFDVVVRNKLGRHLWCNASDDLIDRDDEQSLVLALEKCRRESDSPPG